MQNTVQQALEPGRLDVCVLRHFSGGRTLAAIRGTEQQVRKDTGLDLKGLLVYHGGLRGGGEVSCTAAQWFWLRYSG